MVIQYERMIVIVITVVTDIDRALFDYGKTSSRGYSVDTFPHFCYEGVWSFDDCCVWCVFSDLGLFITHIGVFLNSVKDTLTTDIFVCYLAFAGCNVLD